MTRIVDGPLPGMHTSLRGNSSAESGPYLVDLGKAAGPVIFDGPHMLEVHRAISEKFGGGVTMQEHLDVSRRLKEATERTIALEDQERNNLAQIDELERKLATRTDDLNSAVATNAILELRIAGLRADVDPATLASRSIAQAITETAANGSARGSNGDD